MNNFRSFILKCPKTVVFVGTFLLFLGLQLSSKNFISTDDPYLHAAQAFGVWSHNPVQFPAFSGLSIDVYPLYHLLLAPFTAFFNGTNYEALIIGSKIFHALLASLIFLAFYICLEYLFKKSGKTEDSRRLTMYAILGTMYFFFMCPAFLYRVIMERPQLVYILFTLIVFYALIRKKYLLLFFVSVLFPWLSSVFFLLLVPACIYLVAECLYYWRRPSPTAWAFIITGILGLGLGTIVMPHPILYLYDSFYIHIHVILNSFYQYPHIVIEGSEMSPYPFQIRADAIWLISYFATVIFLIIRYIDLRRNKTQGKSLTFEKFYILILSLVTFTIMIFISRTIEEFCPIAAMIISIVFVEDFAPALFRIPNTIFPQKRFVRTLFLVLFFTYFIITVAYISAVMHAEAPSYLQYQGAAQYLKDHSKPGDIVFVDQLGDYPLLTFFDTTNRYTIGIDDEFTASTYPRDYLLYYDIITKKVVCMNGQCHDPATGIDLYTIIKKDFDSRFVFSDTSDLIKADNGVSSSPMSILLWNIEHDDRFTKVFVDPTYPGIQIFEVSQ